MTRSYKLYSASLTTGDAKASLRIARRGVITAILFTSFGTAGAGVDGKGRFEISKSSASAFTTNDTAPPVIVTGAVAYSGAVNSQAFAPNILFAGLATPVDVLDTLYLHLTTAGTLAASGDIAVTIIVNEV